MSDKRMSPRDVAEEASRVIESRPSGGRGLETVCMFNVEPTEVQWLWQDRIPLGKVSMLSGEPGLGKSTVALDLIARTTRGAAMPDEDDVFAIRTRVRKLKQSQRRHGAEKRQTWSPQEGTLTVDQTVQACWGLHFRTPRVANTAGSWAEQGGRQTACGQRPRMPVM